jgi:phosphate transport system substrate-binding protein
MLELAAEEFMAERPAEAITVGAGNSIRGFKGVIEGTCDIGMIASGITRTLKKLAEENGVELDYTPIAIDGVVPVVHPSNPVRNISIEKLRAIFSGRITDWAQLGGPDLPILPISQPPTIGSFQMFSAGVMEDTVFTPKAPVLEGLAVMRKVATTPEAIGYIASGYVSAKVATVSINGIALSDDTLRSGAFPLVRALNLVMRRGGYPLAAEFIKYVATAEKVQSLAVLAGAVSLR